MLASPATMSMRPYTGRKPAINKTKPLNPQNTPFKTPSSALPPTNQLTQTTRRSLVSRQSGATFENINKSIDESSEENKGTIPNSDTHMYIVRVE